MAEPQPSQIQEGDQAPSAVPASNKSEAAALNSLDRQATETKTTNSKSAAALGDAMKGLNLSGVGHSELKNVKVELADVVLLVSLELVYTHAWLWGSLMQSCFCGTMRRC